MKCRLCSRPMMHTRLYGYQCSNPQHAHILHEIYTRANWDQVKIGKLIREEQKKWGYDEKK